MDWRRRFVPGAPDLVFGLVLVSVMIGGSTGLLNDPGTCWHLRLGREIARTGAVPRFDTLTYTRDHVAWVDQSWAFDLGLALGVVRGHRPDGARAGGPLQWPGAGAASRRELADRRRDDDRAGRRGRGDPFPHPAPPVHVGVRALGGAGLPGAA